MAPESYLKLRPEVEEALKGATEKIADGILLNGDGGFKMRGSQRALLALVELGVRLGLEAAAAEAVTAYIPSFDYQGMDGHGGLANAAADIRALKPADILYTQPDPTPPSPLTPTFLQRQHEARAHLAALQAETAAERAKKAP